MNEMIKAERNKICSRKQTRMLFLAGVVLIVAYFFFFQFNYQNVFYDYDLEKMASASGFTAIEQRKEVAEIFEGKLSQNTLLTMQEKIDQAKQATVGQDENSAFSAVHVYRDQAAILEYLTNSDGSFKSLETAYPNSPTVTLGYCDGWDKLLSGMGSILSIMICLIVVITLSPVFSEEYALHTDSIIYSARYGRTKLTTSKIIAALEVVIGTYLLYLLLNLVLYGCTYGLQGWNVSIQSSLHYASSIYRAQKKAMRNLPCKPADNKKFTFVRYADDWLAGVCGTKAECEDLKAEIAEFLSTELKLTLSEEKTLITHSSEKVRFIGYDICVRRNQEVKGHRMKNGTWRKSRTLHMKVALSVPHTEKIEKFMFAKKVIRQKENGEFQPIHRAGLLNLADYEIVEQYNAEARGLCNYYNLACDYHTLDYFCYLMEYSCLKTIANKHKTSIRKIIRQYKDGKTWSVPYETKAGTKRVRPVKIADCKRGEASDIIYQRKKFSWKTTIRQRLNARVCELCGCKEADLYEVHVIRNLNELGNSDWETVMKKKRRKTLVVCSKCHERIHRH